MKPKTFMLIAGEASGDILAAELVHALRERFSQRIARPTNDNQPLHSTLSPRFFGAGGPQMAAAGVELAFDLTRYSVIGFFAVFRRYRTFRRLFHQLLDLAGARQPDVIICVDYAGFNRRFARAIRKRTRHRGKWFHDWRPLIVQYVSPQVWASRESRVYQIARDYDLILSTFGFEQAWYERRVPGLRVEFVGNPIIDRYGLLPINETPKDVKIQPAREPDLVDDKLSVLLLPGSRKAEVERHLPVMMNALTMMRTVFPNLRARMVLPDNEMLARVRSYRMLENVSPQVGGLGEALRETTIAIAKTGTVALECAYFGVPTVAIYRTSWIEYQIGKLIVTVRYAAMPNLLADREIFPEFIAYMATPGNIARAALDLLRNPQRRRDIKTQLRQVVASLGTPGASQRAADAILRLDPKLLL